MNDQATPVRVWDLPTRVFHWTLALSVIASIVSAWIGGNAMDWHLRLGFLAITLLAFRLVWGLVGGHWSRFANFIYAPATTLRYLRGASRADEHHEVGHNPLGAFSVFALLAFLIAQVATGLFADDEIATTGPFAKFVADSTSHALTRWHRNVGQWAIIALVVLHVGAILFYLFKRDKNLVRPMLTGDKHLSVAAPASVDNWRTRLLALVLWLGCAALVAWLWSFGA